MTDIFISRTDDLSFVDKLFDPVCGPAGDMGDSKDRGVELFWKAKHVGGSRRTFFRLP